MQSAFFSRSLSPLLLSSLHLLNPIGLLLSEFLDNSLSYSSICASCVCGIGVAYCQSFWIDPVLDHTDAHAQLIAIESCVLHHVSSIAILRYTSLIRRVLAGFEAEKELTSRVLIS